MIRKFIQVHDLQYFIFIRATGGGGREQLMFFLNSFAFFEIYIAFIRFLNVNIFDKTVLVPPLVLIIFYLFLFWYRYLYLDKYETIKMEFPYRFRIARAYAIALVFVYFIFVAFFLLKTALYFATN
jgi:hypothetical protein